PPEHEKMRGLGNRFTVAARNQSHVGTTWIKAGNGLVTGRLDYAIVILELMIGSRFQEINSAPKDVGRLLDRGSPIFNQVQNQIYFACCHGLTTFSRALGFDSKSDSDYTTYQISCQA